ncbi:MAG: hypothetical protein Q7J09_07225 [Methanocalculus sp.]|uniref:hypothetical protein n=1 Tax=Methanocalculus sp. TaxID=2004547 RepID=UPI002728E8FC|nr:hypothetical protein [Methanocalculus sp.]MDO9539775.1 hypothetical protein [Methanocalculus sp.]
MARNVLLVLLLVLICSAAGCIHPETIPPSITPVVTDEPIRLVDHSFLFEESSVTISIPIDPAVYYGARDADKLIYLYKDLDDEEWLPIYYAAFMNDPQQERFYTDLISMLQSVRRDLLLDDDRYLELCSVFVQSLPYDDDTTLIEPKFPIETYADGTGDCDDKSLLLAAILVREGYDVALFFFSEEKHMTVGIRADGCFDQESGYAYIETTKTHFVGLKPQNLSGGLVLSSTPLIIPVGDGTRGYGRCDETTTLADLLVFCREEINRLKDEMEVDLAGILVMEEEISLRRVDLNLLMREGRYQEYNLGISGYNAMIDRYNARLNRYNDLVRDADRLVEIHNLILERGYDRQGLYDQMIQEGIIDEMKRGSSQ